VCGTTRWKALSKALRKMGAPPKEATCSGNLYRFGSGVAKAVATWQVYVQVGRVHMEAKIDLVRGGLPLLMGSKAIREFSLVVDGGKGQILQRVGTTMNVVDQYELDQLPSVNVLPVGGNVVNGCGGGGVTYGAWVTDGTADERATVVSSDADSDVTAESMATAVDSTEPTVDAGGGVSNDNEELDEWKIVRNKKRKGLNDGEKDELRTALEMQGTLEASGKGATAERGDPIMNLSAKPLLAGKKVTKSGGKVEKRKAKLA